jgi:hypothetical protein
MIDLPIFRSSDLPIFRSSDLNIFRASAMPITINSPFSGRPVKIRDQDIGRAVRDEEGRVFYVVPRRRGEGYYSAPTRKGSAKDEERYDKMETRLAQVEQQVQAQAAAVHDATGRRRANPLARLVLLLVVLAGLAAGGYFAFEAWQAAQTGEPLIDEPIDTPTDGPLPDLLPDVPKPDLQWHRLPPLRPAG